jgi:prevent-host-death family protein
MRRTNNSTVPFSEARTHLTDVVNEVAYRGERIILTRKGKHLAAIIPLEDLAALEAIEDQIDIEDAKKALRDIEKHGTVSWDKVKNELKL